MVIVSDEKVSSLICTLSKGLHKDLLIEIFMQIIVISVINLLMKRLFILAEFILATGASAS